MQDMMAMKDALKQLRNKGIDLTIIIGSPDEAKEGQGLMGDADDLEQEMGPTDDVQSEKPNDAGVTMDKDDGKDSEELGLAPQAKKLDMADVMSKGALGSKFGFLKKKKM